ncbi:MAG: T9SS type A sorting domain-containing protein [Bacteroidetes bacterium]|nr:T9SS type A sorting domain-containing protein [Bacteroidota bacterium]
MHLKHLTLILRLILSDYKDGIYFIKLKSGNGESSKRIILKK